MRFHSGLDLIETLARSEMFHEYSRAFSKAVNLPIALQPLESWRLPFHGRAHENGFCALMASKSSTCARCLQVQERLCAAAKNRPAMLTCSNGLMEAAAPIRLGNQTIGFLQTGQAIGEKPTGAQFRHVARLMAEREVNFDCGLVKRAYFQTPVVPRDKLNGILHLLSIFADTLGHRSNEIALRESNSEPPAIREAKAYIQAHHSGELSLGQVASTIHMSTYYFCKMFKKKAGMNFTEFVARTRIERARDLLLNPNLRISEIAYEAGFQSLTHFNRVFKQILRESPSEFRQRLPAARLQPNQRN